MENPIEILESFNRKERFFLIAQALGQYEEPAGGKKEAKFGLDKDFRRCLERKIGENIPGDKDVFVAMDYHLNWIHASLTIARGDQYVTKELVKQSQDDIDLLVAFQDADDRYHLIFFDAKGYSSNPSEHSTESQMFEHFKLSETGPKIERLNAILKDHNGNNPKVMPHFYLMSGYEQRNLDSFPSIVRTNGEEIRPTWLKLRLPHKRRIVRFPENSVRIDKIKLKI